MNDTLFNNPYIQEIVALNQIHLDRNAFHEASRPILKAMGEDTDFLKKVIRRNFDDQGYLNQVWSLYNIPFFYIYETPDFYIKLHFFVPLEHHEKGVGASCIHHHNNYILTTAAILGSGYETMLFSKEIDMDEKTLETKMRVTKHFTQQDQPIHCIDAWEPHVVYNPETFSATLQLWTPDKKRSTDQFRNVSLLKLFKKPIRKIIYMCGLERAFGIAAAKTYQWYPEGDHFKAIEENTYFEPTRKAVGPEIDDYSIQTVCKFIQEKGLVEPAYLQEVLQRKETPSYYKPWLEKLIKGEEIPATYAKNTLNIPSKGFKIAEVAKAAHYSL